MVPLSWIWVRRAPEGEEASGLDELDLCGELLLLPAEPAIFEFRRFIVSELSLAFLPLNWNLMAGEALL